MVAQTRTNVKQSNQTVNSKKGYTGNTFHFNTHVNQTNYPFIVF